MVQQHLADGYVEGHSWGDWATKAAAIKQMGDKSIKFAKGDISDVKVTTFGSNTAIARYTYTYDCHLQRHAPCSVGNLQRHLDEPVWWLEADFQPLFARRRKIERAASAAVNTDKPTCMRAHS